MSNLFNNQTFLTIISGVLIFVLGQVVKDFVLKPIQDFYRTIADISHKLKFHSNVLTNSNVRKDSVQIASGDMRDLSSNLEALYVVIPFKGLFSSFNIIPSRDNIKIAEKNLIFLSNAGGDRGLELKNADAIDKIKESLNIEL